jgi:hypothetical protein
MMIDVDDLPATFTGICNGGPWDGLKLVHTSRKKVLMKFVHASQPVSELGEYRHTGRGGDFDTNGTWLWFSSCC